MQLWAVTMVKDELDVIEHTLCHLASEGVHGIIVADNLSEDGTWPYIKSLNIGCELHCTQDFEVSFYQGRKVTNLARQAFAGGADWVIPFDADEIWYSTKGTLYDAVLEVQQQHNANLAYAKLYNYHPTSKDEQREWNPFLRITHRNPIPAELRKVIVRRGHVEIAQGNHDAIGPAPFIRATSTIEVAHFPWRSWPQFKRKVVNGYAGYKATDLPEDSGAHWRGYGRILEEHGEEVLRKEVYERWFFDPEATVQQWPAPFCAHSDYR